MATTSSASSGNVFQLLDDIKKTQKIYYQLPVELQNSADISEYGRIKKLKNTAKYLALGFVVSGVLSGVFSSKVITSLFTIIGIAAALTAIYFMTKAKNIHDELGVTVRDTLWFYYAEKNSKKYKEQNKTIDLYHIPDEFFEHILDERDAPSSIEIAIKKYGLDGYEGFESYYQTNGYNPSKSLVVCDLFAHFKDPKLYKKIRIDFEVIPSFIQELLKQLGDTEKEGIPADQALAEKLSFLCREIMGTQTLKVQDWVLYPGLYKLDQKSFETFIDACKILQNPEYANEKRYNIDEAESDPTLLFIDKNNCYPIEEVESFLKKRRY